MLDMMIHRLFDFLFCQEEKKPRRELREFFRELFSLPIEAWDVRPATLGYFGYVFETTLNGRKIKIYRLGHDCVDLCKFLTSYLKIDDFALRGPSLAADSFTRYHPFNLGPKFRDGLPRCNWVGKLYANLERKVQQRSAAKSVAGR